MPQYTGIWTLTQVSQAIQDNNWIGIKPPSVEYLVVAGGGGGATYGGGGAGGLLTGIASVTPGSAITVTIGGGGSGGTGYIGGANTPATQGQNSVFGNITATGGGRGGLEGQDGGNGGSGGGGGGGAFQVGGVGITGQGNAGGTGHSQGGNANYAGGGGGGAGQQGMNDNYTVGIAGNGGAGVTSDITGTRTAYAGGGGGGTYLGTIAYRGAGGTGGGGNGGYNGGTNGEAGVANTGGGGGGARYYVGTGGNGGSGVVILSYSDIYAAPTATSGGPTVTTSGSGSINTNTAARVTYANNAAFQFGTGNFTVEAFVNIPAISTWQIIAKCADDSSWANGWTLNLNNGIPQFYGIVNGTSALAINTWYHIAAVRNSGVVTLYVNGSSVASASNSTNLAPTPSLSVGGEISSTSYPLNGYVSNLRIVKGVALYTSNFTAPTAPLTAVSGTSLLLNTVSGSVFSDSSSNSFQPATAPNTPTWNQLSPFPTGFGYKNRVYTWTTTGTVTF